MKIYVKNKALELQARRRAPEYLADLAPAIVDRNSEGVFFDTKHPAWKAAIEKYRPARQTEQPLASPSKTQPAFIAHRREICSTCPSKPSCPVWQGSSCRAKNLLSRANMICPADPPKWGPDINRDLPPSKMAGVE